MKHRIAPLLLIPVVVPIVAALLLRGQASAEEQLTRHRLTFDLLPYTSWGWFIGHAAAYPDDKFDETVGSVGLGAGWEYLPVRWIGVGAAFDLRVPASASAPVLLMPLGSLRAILPLVDGRLELYLLLRAGGAFFVNGDSRKYGWSSSPGWSADASLGAGWALDRRWSIMGRVGYRLALTEDFDNPVGFDGVLSVSYRL